ncbi:MAG: hypothetical protein HFF06_01605 [Oscillospiraceae bacterium]|nr:hypothetical protein [Oscillospiraceae bacterium]
MSNIRRFQDNQPSDLPFTYQVYIPNNNVIMHHDLSTTDLSSLPSSEKASLMALSKYPFEYDDYITAEFTSDVLDADKQDYLVAAASGLLTAILNEFWVGELSLVEAKNWGSDQINKFVEKIARSQGYKGKWHGESGLTGAIGFLEDNFPLPADKLTADFGGGRQHHLRDFSHHPSLVGLLFSILTQFTGKGYGTDKSGSFTCHNLPENILLGTNIYEKLFNGTILWFFHLVSDMAGSNQTAGFGTGIPGPLLSFLKEASSLLLIKNIQIQYENDEISFSQWCSKLFNGTYFKRKTGEIMRFDLRVELGMLHQFAKQSVPVIANEVFVRTFYFMRRLYREIQSKNITSIHDLDKLDPNAFLPFNNRTITRMTTISSGVFVAATLAAAGVKATVKSKGLHSSFAKAFILNVNFIGIGRFVFACVADAKYIIKDWEKTYQIYVSRQKKLGLQILETDILKYLSLSPEQTRILYSLEWHKTNCDIEKDQSKDRKVKMDWIFAWEREILENLNAQDNYLIKDLNILATQIEQANTACDHASSWLYLVAMELVLFNPYFSLNSKDNKRYKSLKYVGNFEEKQFQSVQTTVSWEDCKLFLKRYKAYISKLQNQTAKLLIGTGATLAVTIATSGLAWTFAPGIATTIAGSAVAGLHGAALTNASLALIGGGSLAVGGLGIAGGTAIITGGGALLGMIGTGAVSAITMVLTSKEFALNECAKLLTFCDIVLINKKNDINQVSTIMYSLESIADELAHQIQQEESRKETEDNPIRQDEKNRKGGLACIQKCHTLMEKMIFKQNLSS